MSLPLHLDETYLRLFMRPKKACCHASFSGVYYLFDNKANLIYIGQSKNISKRVFNHPIKFSHFSFVSCERSLLDQIETEAIVKFQPDFNYSTGNGKIGNTITLPEAIKFCSISKAAFWKIAENVPLKGIRMGNRHLFTPSDLVDWMGRWHELLLMPPEQLKGFCKNSLRFYSQFPQGRAV